MMIKKHFAKLWTMTVTILVLGVVGCKKYNGIDNASTVKTPYVLYIGGFNGTLHKTNDGTYFNTLFPTDNSTVRQVIVADSVLLYLKRFFYHSKDEGRSFKMSTNLPVTFLNTVFNYFIPNSALYNPADRKVYLCTTTGLQVSEDLGVTFSPETNWLSPAPNPPGPASPKWSITLRDNGLMYLMIDSATQYKKVNSSTGWELVTQSANFPLPTNSTNWFVSSTHDTLLAIDYFGNQGSYYSVNDGAEWNYCGGLPTQGKRVLFANEAFGANACYIGLDSAGLYRLKGNIWEPVGAGIPWNAKVSFVEGKRIVYRTGVVRYYLFCATNVGLYVSEIGGNDWRLLREGNYSTLH
jgi:hypothetical protein